MNVSRQFAHARLAYSNDFWLRKSALRGLAWVQVQASTEEIDGGLEILDVPEPAGSEFHRRDP